MTRSCNCHILESFWRSLVAREVAKQIEVVFKITGGVTKFLRAQLSENSRVPVAVALKFTVH